MSDRLPPRLARLIAALEACQTHTSATVARVLAAAPLELADVADWAQFDPRNYRRNLLLRRPGFEVRLLCWAPYQRTSLHSHDRSACAFRVLRGTATEIRVGEADRRWPSGSVVEEEAGGVVHQVTNLTDGPLVSLHVYAPPLPIDQPPTTYEGRHIVVVGGGVSGVALTIHMLALGAARVSIVERRQGLGRGPAYGTSDPSLRLNVPAGRMSLFPDRPDDFIAWARARGTDWSASQFLPRQLFGAYVEGRLVDAIRAGRGKLWLHRSEAIAASAAGVTLADGTALASDAVVLATGNQLPAAPAAFSAELLMSSRVVGDPWADGALADIAADETLLLVGTGLTAVDVLLALHNQGHRGRVVASSRHGLLPRPHLAADDLRRGAVEIDPSGLPRSIGGLCRRLRDEVRRAAASGVAWQCVVDALRPHTTEIWRSLTLAEQRRFMAIVRPYWEVLRHRAASDLLDALAAWQSRGWVEVVAGRITAARERDGVEVDMLPRSGGAAQRRRFDRVILCTGPQTDVRQWSGALYRQLLAAGDLVGDPLALGVMTDDRGSVLDDRGRASPWLFTLGSLRRPHLWETTAVPDIVRQAAALARTLAEVRVDRSPPPPTAWPVSDG